MTSTICHPALKTKSVSTCIGELTIGMIAALSTNIIVFIRDITIGQTYRFQETSDPTGLVMVDLSEQDLSDRHSYELWITKVNEQSNQSIKIGDDYALNVALNFERCIEDGEIVELPQMTLEAI